MKRNAFGDPQPGTAQEIAEAIDEIGITKPVTHISPPYAVNVGSKWEGWTAVIIDSEDPDMEIGTLGFPTKEALVAALKDAYVPEPYHED